MTKQQAIPILAAATMIVLLAAGVCFHVGQIKALALANGRNVTAILRILDKQLAVNRLLMERTGVGVAPKPDTSPQKKAGEG